MRAWLDRPDHVDSQPRGRHHPGEAAVAVVGVERVGEGEDRAGAARRAAVVGVDVGVEVGRVGERPVDREVAAVHGAAAQLVPLARARARAAAASAAGLLGPGDRGAGDGVDAGDPVRAGRRGSGRASRGRRSTAPGNGRQPLSGSYMSSAGSTENGSASSVTDGSMTCSMNTPSPGWAARATKASPRWRPSRSAVAWARAMSEPPPLLPSSTTVLGATRPASPPTAVSTSTTQPLVQAVDVVVHVAGGEAEHRVPGGGEQRAGVVDVEKSPRGWDSTTAVRHGVPAGGVQRMPRTTAPSGDDEGDGLAADLDAGVVGRDRASSRGRPGGQQATRPRGRTFRSSGCRRRWPPARAPRPGQRVLGGEWNTGIGGASSSGASPRRIAERAVLVGLRVRGGVGAELHEDPVRVHGVDARAEPVVDLHDVDAGVEPLRASPGDVVEAVGGEGDVVDPRLEARARWRWRCRCPPCARRAAPRRR